MKITEITIVLKPSAEEKKVNRIELKLIRTIDKIWKVEYEEYIDTFGSVVKERGLFPYELRLANDIQEMIISKFNGSQE